MNKIALLAMVKYRENNLDLRIGKANEIFEFYIFLDEEELLFTAQDLERQGYKVCLMM